MTSTHRNLPSKAGLSLLQAVGAQSPQQQQLIKGAVMAQGNDLLCSASHHLPEHRLSFSVLCSQLWGLPAPSVCTSVFITAAVSTSTPSRSELQHGWHSSARTLLVFLQNFCKEITHPQCFTGEAVSKQGEDLGWSSHRGSSLGSAELGSPPASVPATGALRF